MQTGAAFEAATIEPLDPDAGLLQVFGPRADDQNSIHALHGNDAQHAGEGPFGFVAEEEFKLGCDAFDIAAFERE